MAHSFEKIRSLLPLLDKQIADDRLTADGIALLEREITVSHLHFDNISSWSETDRLVYGLYVLTDEEINLVGGSR